MLKQLNHSSVQALLRMIILKKFKLILLISILTITNNLFAHGGDVDINGCHVQKVLEKSIVMV